jgi:hypothetical protein
VGVDEAGGREGADEGSGFGAGVGMFEVDADAMEGAGRVGCGMEVEEGAGNGFEEASRGLLIVVGTF